MDHSVFISARSPEIERQWEREIRAALGDSAAEFPIVMDSSATPEARAAVSLLLVDSRCPDLVEKTAALKRDGTSVFVVLDEADQEWDLDSALIDHVDDVLVHPFRRAEILSKLKFHHHLRLWAEVNELNSSFQSVLQSLGDDIQLTERLQKAKLPVRFPNVKGLRLQSRYLAGMRAGGDHFDIAESRDGSRISFVLSDSSSYGLSSSLLATLMRVTMKLSQDEVRSSLDTVRLIHDELALTMKDRDLLSLFYGVLSRKDYVLKYLCLGTPNLFHARKGAPFSLVPAGGSALGRVAPDWIAVTERELKLEPEDRLVLMSDGYVEKLGGSDGVLRTLNSIRGKEPNDLLNEMTFQVKKDFAEPDDLPEQDCSALVMDIDAKLLRLA